MKPSRAFWILYAVVLILSSCSKSPDSAWASFQDAFNAAHPEFRNAEYASPAVWEKTQRECADAEAYAARALAMAKTQPKSDIAKQELWWIIVYCTDVPSSKEAIELFSRDYSDQFPIKCTIIDRHESWEDHCFQAMAERSPNRQMRGQAILARARYRHVIMHDNITAEGLYDQVIAQFADIKSSKESAATLGELAKDDLMNLRSPDRAGKLLHAGDKVPPFEVTAIDGRSVKVPDSYKGKILLIDFWATWCGPCVQEIPNVVNAYNNYHAKGLEVLGVSLDEENAGETLARFVKDHNMFWPQVYDGKWINTPLARQLGITGTHGVANPGIPFALIVDGDTGMVIADGRDVRGPRLATAIEGALAKRQPMSNDHK